MKLRNSTPALTLIFAAALLLPITCFAYDSCDTDQDGILSGSEQYLCQHPETESIGKNVQDVQGAQTPSNSVTIERNANGKIKRNEQKKQPQQATEKIIYDSELDSENGTDYPTSSGGDSTIHTGSRGGRYTITSGGNKSYVKH